MNRTDHGNRQSLLEHVRENEALEDSGTPQAELDENIEQEKSLRISAIEVHILVWQFTKAEDISAYP